MLRQLRAPELIQLHTSVRRTHTGRNNSHAAPGAQKWIDIVGQQLEKRLIIWQPFRALRETQSRRTGVCFKAGVNRVRTVVDTSNSTEVSKRNADEKGKATSQNTSISSGVGRLGRHATGLEVQSSQISHGKDKYGAPVRGSGYEGTKP